MKIRIGILGYGSPVITILEALQGSNVKVIGVQQDFRRDNHIQKEFTNILNRFETPLVSSLPLHDLDLILVMNYNKIIDVYQYQSLKLINLHMGILPTWRGNSANSWAVLNGENFVGYTIHKVNEELDGGDIYYSFETPVDLSSTYANARIAIYDDIKKSLPSVLTGIFDGTYPARSQMGQPFVYCAKIRKSDGVIRSWDVPCDLLLRKQYLFGPPGTGLSFYSKGNSYSIGQLLRVKGFKESLGISGSIVNIIRNSLWVKVKDTAIAISGITLNGSLIDSANHFKIGNRLENA